MANEYSFVSSISSRPQPLIDERTNRTDAVRGSEMSTLSQSSAPHRAGGDEESTGLPPGAEIPVPRGGSTRQLCPGTTVTPCRAMNDGLCTTLKSEKFDLLASLSRPLTWQPHKGKLKPFPESQYIRNAAGKPNRETRTGKAEFILMGNQKTMPEEESSVSKKHVLPGISGKKVPNNSRAAKASKSACGDMFIPREEPEVHGKEKTTIKAILELSLAIPLQFVDETATSDLKGELAHKMNMYQHINLHH